MSWAGTGHILSGAMAGFPGQDDGEAVHISGIYERPGLSRVLIARFEGDLLPAAFTPGVSVLLKTKFYKASGRIIYIETGRWGYNIYLNIPFRGKDPGGGKLMIINRYGYRNVVEDEKKRQRDIVLAIIVGGIVVGSLIFLPMVLKK